MGVAPSERPCGAGPIEGERGELRTDRSRVWCRLDGEKKHRQLDAVEMPEGESLRYPDAGMVSMMAQFRNAIAQGAEPETSGRDNLWTLAMFEAAMRSSENGEFVAMSDVFTAELWARAGVDQSGGAA